MSKYIISNNLLGGDYNRVTLNELEQLLLRGSSAEEIITDEEFADELLELLYQIDQLSIMVNIVSDETNNARRWISRGAKNVFSLEEWESRTKTVKTNFQKPEIISKYIPSIKMTKFSDSLKHKFAAKTKIQGDDEEENTVDEKEEMVDLNEKSKRIVLFAPESTGKTFVGINLGVAYAMEGLHCLFIDTSDKAKLLFNAPIYPFTLQEIPLTLGGKDLIYQKKFDVVIYETRDPESAEDFQGIIITVVDSDPINHILTLKKMLGVDVQGIIWNKKDERISPASVIPLPIIITLPYFKDACISIAESKPIALYNSELRDMLRQAGI